MPSGAYAPVRNPRADEDADEELRAAFDESDDEHDESHPLNPTRRRSTDSDDSDDDAPLPTSSASRAAPAAPPIARSAPPPGTYDFESTAYDFPPPGSPPPATRAFANDWGNSNGVLPTPPAPGAAPPGPRRSWLGRTASAVLPQRVSERLGLAPARPTGAVGGGTQNDGVFANVTAKPVRGVRVQDGDESYIVPETTQVERPPSYMAAQADSAPTYWEATSVYVPPGGSSVPGEVIVEGLPTGTLFSFLWNALISVSFQFVGFLLTYLLHTTHAARFGARAGLGVTLIQYGFAMRRAEKSDGGMGEESTFEPRPTFATAKEAEAWYANHNATAPNPGAFGDDDDMGVTESTAEWLAFFLMTIGWFVLLTSVLGYWRVKRWERSILSTPDPSAPSSQRASAPGGGRLRHIERLFTIPGLAGARGGLLLRQGLGLDRRGQAAQDDLYFHVLDLETGPQEEDERTTRPGHTQFVIDENDPEDADRAARALVAEQRLNHDLRAAGLL